MKFASKYLYGACTKKMTSLGAAKNIKNSDIPVCGSSNMSCVHVLKTMLHLSTDSEEVSRVMLNT